ncbi:MAG: DNA-3-methyladenine glycosylase 2 family protein [Bacteroidetes bacterium]|nr:DNA-3-methyladenine glycosylase 2 family protein [Bacteroidota bacterium]
MQIAAIQHFRKDPVLGKMVDLLEFPEIEPQPAALYENLLISILSQQLSAKAASTIHSRFVKLFPREFPDPNLLRKMDDETLRSAGVSRQKSGYLRNIAARFDEENLVHADWAAWSDEEIVEHLTQIKGVGTWTARMILMFTLGRPDIFPTGDMGIQSAMEKWWGLPEKGKARIAAMIEIAEDWRPYRTYACRYLWEAKDTGIIL